MVKKIEGRYFVREQVMEYIKEADRMISEYGWQNRDVYPYGYPIKVTKIMKDLKDYDRCTKGSKEYLVMLANGLAEIFNAWEEQENEPKVMVLLKKSGKELEVSGYFAEILIGEGIAVLA